MTDEQKPWAWLEEWDTSIGTHGFCEEPDYEGYRLLKMREVDVRKIPKLVTALRLAKKCLETYACLAEREEPLGVVKGHFARMTLDKLAKGNFDG